MYEKIVRQQRKEIAKLTLEQQGKVLGLYDHAIGDLIEKASGTKDKSLGRRWTLDYFDELERVRNELERELEVQILGSSKKAAKIGTKAEQQVMTEIFRKANIDTGDHFTSMFSQVQDNVVRDIITGNLYKDKRTLSQRIWNHGEDFEKDIQYTINQAILQKKSAIELAADLEKFVREPARRGTTWGRCYPNLRNKRVDYNAMRLARTSINHSYQTASIQASNLNPFVEGIEWQSALIHGRTCELCKERHGQVFDKKDVPLDHPNGLCTMLPVIEKSLDKVADELRDWLYGGENPILDEWYENVGKKMLDGRIYIGKLDKIRAKRPGITKKLDNKVEELVAKVNRAIEIDITNRRKIAKQLLKDMELEHVKVGIRKIDVHGYCKFNVKPNATYDVREYVLKSTDMRNDEYKLKTLFHELFHASFHGHKTDMHMMNMNDYLQIEETFAETSAHFLYKFTGRGAEISPSYADRLVEMLPRLKQLEEFKDCKTLSDFGEKAWEIRLNEKDARWAGLYEEVMKVNHNWLSYAGQYVDYIDENLDDLLDLMLENMPKYKHFKEYMKADYRNAKAKIEMNEMLSGNEKMVLQNILINAMNRLGVK